MSDLTTILMDESAQATIVQIPRFALRIKEGPDAPLDAKAVDGKLTVGTADGAELKLTDKAVSRFHLELEATRDGIALRDLGSRNGTWISGMQVKDVVLTRSAEITVGRTKLELIALGERDSVEVPKRRDFGRLVGGSVAMRALFATLARVAPTTAPVLISGESGTGKELAAHAIHEASTRADGPFEVVDCGGLPPTLIESELFGHERGAFTGADRTRTGAFERAAGGTLFLDELGELPLDLQPKLLRAVGEGEFRRLGGSETKKSDVRIVCATNRDLRAQINSGHFRSDLYFRLAVIQVRMPPLRERTEDLPLLVSTLLAKIREERGMNVHLELDDEAMAPLQRHTWPGNIRELRNYLEQLVILNVAPDLPKATAEVAVDDAMLEPLLDLPLRRAKELLVDRFERRYIERIVEAAGGNLAEAARRAGVDRVTLWRTMRRHGVDR